MSYLIPTNLPKDLPENWTDTQYVSPGGVDVGLTPQHGYNYLMKQVNNAQAGVLALGQAVCSVNNNLLDNSFFMDVVNRKNGYIAPAGIEYYGDDDYGSVQGQLSQNCAAYIDWGIGYITLNGRQYSVKPEQLIMGYIHGTSGTFGFDRWWGYNAIIKCKSGNAGVTISAQGTSGGFVRQPIVNPKLIAGRKVVISAYVSGLTGTSYMRLHKSNKVDALSATLVASKQLSTGLNSLVIDIPSDIGNNTYPYLFFTIECTSKASVDVVAVKMQPGLVSTLAYQDDSNNWHIVDVPNKVLEIVRCNGAPVELGGQGMIVTPGDIGLSAANVLAKASVIK